MKDAMEEDVKEIFPRAEGGMMSTRAATRSRSDSEVFTSRPDATEISESSRQCCVVSKYFDEQVTLLRSLSSHYGVRVVATHWKSISVSV